MSSPQDTSDESGRVVAFRPREAGSSGEPSKPQVPDLNRYARGPDHGDDDRHRMLTNLAAFAFCVLLVIAGVWMVNVIADMRKKQDCVLSGRRNCAQVEVPAQDRW